MLIFDYKPNGYAPDEYFLYSGDLALLEKVSKAEATRVNGWAVTADVLWFKKVRFVFFGKGDEVFLHSVDGMFNCSSDDTKITYRRLLNLLFVSVHVLGRPRPSMLSTPVLRFIENDGMFASEAQPLLDILGRLADPTEHRRLAKALSAGIALPGGCGR